MVLTASSCQLNVCILPESMQILTLLKQEYGQSMCAPPCWFGQGGRGSAALMTKSVPKIVRIEAVLMTDMALWVT